MLPLCMSVSRTNKSAELFDGSSRNLIWKVRNIGLTEQRALIFFSDSNKTDARTYELGATIEPYLCLEVIYINISSKHT